MSLTLWSEPVFPGSRPAVGAGVLVPIQGTGLQRPVYPGRRSRTSLPWAGFSQPFRLTNWTSHTLLVSRLKPLLHSRLQGLEVSHEMFSQDFCVAGDVRGQQRLDGGAQDWVGEC